MEAEQRALLEAPAKAEKARTIVEAEAAAERRRIEANAEAGAIFAKLDAQARGEYEVFSNAQKRWASSSRRPAARAKRSSC